MSARTLTRSTADATSGWRQPCHHTRGHRTTTLQLDVLSVDVIGRFLDEGVPPANALYVATETLHCLRVLDAGDELPAQVHYWTREILLRYGAEKVATLFMSTGGRLDR